MSALHDPLGGVLDQLTETARGMTDEEADRFLATGELPDLSQPPTVPGSDRDDVSDELVDEIAVRLALADTSLTAGFDPNQPRDVEGKWTDTGLGGIGEKIVSSDKKLTPATIYRKHADGATVAVSPSGDRRMRWDAGRKKFIVEKRAAATAPAIETPKPTTPTKDWPFSYDVTPDVQAEYGDLAQVSDDAYRNAGGYHLIKLPVASLVPTQENDFMEWGDADEVGMTGKPFVADVGGNLFLIDGHHRAVKAGPHGQIEAWVREIKSGNDNWQKTDTLTKSAAYNDAKQSGRWDEPGNDTGSVEPVDTEQVGLKTAPEMTSQTLEPALAVVEPTVKNTESKDVNEWAKKNFESPTRLAPQERENLEYYTANGAFTINNDLRNGRSKSNEEIYWIDRVMKRNVVKDGVRVRRATGLNTFGGDPSKFVGQEFVDLGYVSTSVGSTTDVQDNPWFANKGVIMDIDVPPGARAYYLDPISKVKGQRELLLARKTRILFESATYSETEKRWTVKARVVVA